MEEVKEIAECSICIDLFTDPRMLPCIHTFCLKCLTEASLKAELKQGKSMPCPLCRTPFVIPTEGMIGLKKNFFMEQLVEITKISKPSDKQIFCENCIEDNEEVNEKPTATNFCINCHKNICNRCCKDHGKYKELKDHQLVAIGSPLKEELMKKFAVHYCERHKRTEVELYCQDCQQVICMTCFAEKHNLHKCSNIETVGDTFREEIKNDLQQIQNISHKVSEKAEEIVTEQNKFQAVVESTEKEVIKRGEELKNLIDSCTRSLLKELSSIRNQEFKRLETAKEEIERHKSVVESLELYLKELVSKGSSVEICRSANDVHSRCESLQKDHTQHNERIITSVEVSLDDSVFKELLESCGNIIGVIKKTDLEIKAEGIEIQEQLAFSHCEEIFESEEESDCLDDGLGSPADSWFGPHNTNTIPDPSEIIQCRQYMHPNIFCDGCDGPIIGMRYKCTICFDFDVCTRCKEKGFHNTHAMEEIPPPPLLGKQSTDLCNPEIPEIMFCNECGDLVEEIGYRCVTCSSYNLCLDCKWKGIHGHHDMKEIIDLSHSLTFKGRRKRDSKRGPSFLKRLFKNSK